MTMSAQSHDSDSSHMTMAAQSQSKIVLFLNPRRKSAFNRVWCTLWLGHATGPMVPTQPFSPSSLSMCLLPNQQPHSHGQVMGEENGMGVFLFENTAMLCWVRASLGAWFKYHFRLQIYKAHESSKYSAKTYIVASFFIPNKLSQLTHPLSVVISDSVPACLPACHTGTSYPQRRNLTVFDSFLSFSFLFLILGKLVFLF